MLQKFEKIRDSQIMEIAERAVAYVDIGGQNERILSGTEQEAEWFIRAWAIAAVARSVKEALATLEKEAQPG